MLRRARELPGHIHHLRYSPVASGIRLGTRRKHACLYSDIVGPSECYKSERAIASLLRKLHLNFGSY